MAQVETEWGLQHESFEAALDDFLTKQQELKKAGFFNPFLEETDKDLRMSIKKSDWFRELYAEASCIFFRPLSDDELNRVRDRFTGAIWENTAYHFLSARQPDDQVVLSPEQTFELFCLVLKEKGEDYQIIQHPFGIKGIEGYGLPDGVIYDLETKKSLFICEFTCHGSEAGLHRKTSSFKLGQQYQKELYADTQLLFVIPDNEEVEVIPDNEEVEGFLKIAKLQSEIVPVPIIPTQLREFITGVIEKYKIDNEPTLLELQESARDPLRQTEIATDPGKFFQVDIGNVEG